MRVIANNYTRHIIKGTDVHSQSAQKVPGLACFAVPFSTYEASPPWSHGAQYCVG